MSPIGYYNNETAGIFCILGNYYHPGAELYNIILGWLWGAMWNRTASWTPGDSLLLSVHYEISSQLLAADCYLEALYHLVISCRVLMMNYHNII
jgi:hypothetical protein